MATSPLVSKKSFLDSLEINNFTSEHLQRGLCLDDKGNLVVKPEIAACISPQRIERIYQLLWSGRQAEANSLAACHLINKVQEFCPNGHDVVKVPVWCGKVFLCEDCAKPGSRVHRLHYDHPYLYEHLMTSKFTVLTLSLKPEDDRKLRSNLEAAELLYDDFISRFNGNHGWMFLAAFSYEDDEQGFETTKMFAIHAGDRLPGYPEMEKLWKSIAGPDSEIKAKMFDGKDGDLQSVGLELAYSGLQTFHQVLHDSCIDGWPHVEYSQEFRGYKTTKLSGYFYGYNGREERIRKESQSKVVNLCVNGCEHEKKSTCGTCGCDMVTDDSLPLMTAKELHERWENIIVGHSSKAIYAQVSRNISQIHMVSHFSSASPPI